MILVIVSMGVMFVMNGVVRFIIGVDDQIFADGARFVIRAREFREMTGSGKGWLCGPRPSSRWSRR